MSDELIARLEKLTGPDRAVGNEVLFACGWTQNEYGLGPSRSLEWVNPDPSGIDYLDGDQPDPTASIDAALTLVPEGAGWLINSVRGDLCFARCFPDSDCPNIDEWGVESGEMSSPAIALCIAALKARANPEGADTARHGVER